MKTAAAVALSTLLAAACAPPLEADAGAGRARPSNGVTPCMAEQHQSFVGRNRSVLPPKPANETWRVACTTCGVTADYNERRLNIFYDERTGIIREVKCG